MSVVAAQVVSELVRVSAERNAIIDVYRLARDLHRQIPQIPEAELVAMIDAAIISTWGATAVWDRDGTGTQHAPSPAG